MGSNASLSIVVSKGWAGVCTPGKINLPTVCRHGWSFSACLFLTFARCFSFSVFFSARRSVRRVHANSIPHRGTCREFTASRRPISKVVKRSLREQEGDFHDRRAYSFDTVYNYVWVRSRAIILFLSIWVQLFWKSNLIDIKKYAKHAPMNHERNYFAKY